MSGPDDLIERSFPVAVHIREVISGEVRVYKHDEYIFTGHRGQWSDLWWTEGNGACDCNRELYFKRSAGLPPSDSEACGEGRYLIEKIIDLETGKTIYTELT